MITREGIKKHWEVIDAWKNGANLEVKRKGEWLSCSQPTFIETAEYRIKPESKPDQYVVVDAIDGEVAGGYSRVLKEGWDLLEQINIEEPRGCDWKLYKLVEVKEDMRGVK